MKFRNVKIIFQKEVIEVIRDWRTVFVMLILPVLLYPLLVVVISQLTLKQAQQLKKEKFRVALRGKGMENIRARLAAHEGLQVVTEDVENPEKALEEGKLHILLEGKRLEQMYTAEQTPRIQIRYNPSKDRSTIARRQIETLLDKYRKELSRSSLQQKGISERYLEPFEISPRSVVSGTRRGRALAAKFLPYLLIIMTLMGAIYPAVDLTAGEKERKTIETLLVSPAMRLEIVMGKFLTVFLISLVTAALNLASMGITFSKFLPLDQIASNIQFSLSPAIVFSVMGIMIPLSALFAGLSLAIASFAKTYREGMMYTTPLVILCILPSMVTALPGVELSYSYAAVPVINASLVFKNFMVPPLKIGPVVVSFISTLIYAAGAILICTWLFTREQILLPDTEGIPFRIHWFTMEFDSKRKVPGVPQIILVLSITVLFLLFAGGVAHRWWGVVPELLVTQFLYVLGPCVLIAVITGYDWEQTFYFRKPESVGKLGKAVLVGLLLIPISISLNQLLLQLFPDLGAGAARYEKIFQSLHAPVWLLFLAVAGVAPFCEEMLFRGFLLSGTRKKLSSLRSAVVVGVLFGLYHLVLLKVLTTAVAGFLLALLVIDSESLWPAVLGHAIFNGSLFLMDLNSGWIEEHLPAILPMLSMESFSYSVLIVSLLSVGLILYLFQNLLDI